MRCRNWDRRSRRRRTRRLQKNWPHQILFKYPTRCGLRNVDINNNAKYLTTYKMFDVMIYHFTIIISYYLIKILGKCGDEI